MHRPAAHTQKYLPHSVLGKTFFLLRVQLRSLWIKRCFPYRLRELEKTSHHLKYFPQTQDFIQQSTKTFRPVRRVWLCTLFTHTHNMNVAEGFA